MNNFYFQFGVSARYNTMVWVMRVSQSAFNLQRHFRWTAEVDSCNPMKFFRLQPMLLGHRRKNCIAFSKNQPETRIIQHRLDVCVQTIRGFMRQPLVTSCVGLAQGCNPLASAVFFGAYLCSDRLSCESLFGRPGRIRTDTIRDLNALPLPKLGY